MSVRRKGSKGPLGGEGFSSLSLGSYPRMGGSNTRQGGSYFGFGGSSSVGAPIQVVRVNRKLLTPLDLQLDPATHTLRTQETQQIKTLNDDFASFINKVVVLEQQNKMLQTKWSLLQDDTKAPSKMEPMLQAYVCSLRAHLASVMRDTDTLEAERKNTHTQVQDWKQRYEDEINKRNGAENQFVVQKKEVDVSCLTKVDLGNKLVGVIEDINFLKTIYDEELRELQAGMRNLSVVVQMDNSRQLNMEQIVADVKTQYEDISARGRQEAEACYKNKFEQVSSQAEQYTEQLRRSKTETSDLKRLIMRLHTEISAATAQCTNVEAQVSEAEGRGQQAVQDAGERIRELEEALRKAKADMARQVRDYQQLLDLKLALDIEINTYRRLLEGEEERVGQDSIINIHTAPASCSRVKQSCPARQSSAPKLLIKMTENQGRYTAIP